MTNENIIGLDYQIPTSKSHIIKVMGVGGGGCNAVKYMCDEGIQDVTFVLCNTDEQVLNYPAIKSKVKLGSGLGAGNRPEVARAAAEESQHEIEEALDANTRMVFVTATMGGGTGTGAAPVVARIARDRGILTIGVVTIPFAWEGKPKMKQAYTGVLEMSKNVDVLIVIQNDKLRDIEELSFTTGLYEETNVALLQAVKGIAELITIEGKINLDFNDVRTTLYEGGFALINYGYGEGEHRIRKAIDAAVNSPLIQDSNIRRAKKIMLNICCSSDVKMKETADIQDWMDEMNSDVDVIWGMTEDEELGKRVKVTILASGFGSDIIKEETDVDEVIKIMDNGGKEVTEQRTYPPFSDLDDIDHLEEIETIPAYQRYGIKIK